jgi:TolA-binding protein
LAFALGLGGGAVLHAWLGSSRERVVTRVVTKEVRVETPAQAPTQAPVAEPPAPAMLPPSAQPDSAPPSGTAAATRPKGSDKPVSADSSPTNDGALAGEAALLLRAQTALSRSATAAAIAALREHARRFPSGQLIEEREALWVQALLVQGDRDAAAARAAQFAKHYPTSPQREVIERALEQAP